MGHAVSTPNPGQIARVRQRNYLVEEVEKPGRATDCTLVRLSCVDDDNQGQPLEVLWEKELREERLKSETRRRQAASGLLITGLQQRLLSSVEAFARTLKVHRRTVQRQWEELQKHTRVSAIRQHRSICSQTLSTATTTGHSSAKRI